jgi:DNA-binding response OmpR family regulator
MFGEDRATVVVCDDDSAIRLLCRVNLELEGYRVLEAADGRQLDEVLAREEVAGLLLDVRLGPDDGLEIAERLHGTHPELRIAFFTGSLDKPEVLKAGATDVLTKPFTLEELSATVRRLVPP